MTLDNPDAPDLATQRPTLAAVARAAGVSEITASRALRGGTHVARATLDRVQAAARALNYVPNRLAGTLAGGSSRQVAVVLPSLSNSVFADVLAGLEAQLDRAGYHAILGVSNYDPAQEERLVADLLSWRPAALVVAPAASTAPTRRMLAGAGVPVVEIMDVDGALDCGGVAPIDMVVGLSQRGAGRAMAQYLLDCGYHRFAYVGHDIATDPRALSRLAGLEQGLAAGGAVLEGRVLLDGPSSVALGRAGVARVLEGCAPGRLAVCFSNDDMAVGGMFHAMAAGLEVPGDIALVGFNGLAIGQALPKPLTSIASRRAEIGDRTAQAILARLGGALVEPVQDVGFHLIVGATT